MDLAQEYRPSHRFSERHARLTQNMGWLPAGLALILLYAYQRKAGPGLWAALGLAISLQMILWSARRIRAHTARRSKLGDRIAASTDRWFPAFLILTQAAITTNTAAIFWFTLIELGYRASLPQSILLALWLFVLPIRRISRLAMTELNRPRDEVLYFFTHYTSHILLTLFIAVTANQAVTPAAETPDAQPIAAIVIWVPAVLIILTFAVLFTDHIVRKLPPRPRSDTTSRDNLG